MADEETTGPEERRYREKTPMRASATKFVDMARSPAEKKEDMPEPMSSEGPDYPWGLCISLTEAELEKLNLKDDMQVGDLIDLRAMAKVTSVSKTQSDGEDHCRIELQIVQLAIENESTDG